MKNVRFEKRSISLTKQRLAMLDEADRPKKPKLKIYIQKDDRYLLDGSNSEVDREAVAKSEPNTVKVVCYDRLSSEGLKRMLTAKNR